jgi:hypothetical protein
MKSPQWLQLTLTDQRQVQRRFFMSDSAAINASSTRTGIATKYVSSWPVERFNKDVDYQQEWKRRKSRYEIAGIELPGAKSYDGQREHDYEKCGSFIHSGDTNQYP